MEGGREGGRGGGEEGGREERGEGIQKGHFLLVIYIPHLIF